MYLFVLGKTWFCSAGGRTPVWCGKSRCTEHVVVVPITAAVIAAACTCLSLGRLGFAQQVAEHQCGASSWWWCVPSLCVSDEFCFWVLQLDWFNSTEEGGSLQSLASPTASHTAAQSQSVDQTMTGNPFQPHAWRGVWRGEIKRFNCISWSQFVYTSNGRSVVCLVEMAKRQSSILSFCNSKHDYSKRKKDSLHDATLGNLMKICSGPKMHSFDPLWDSC